MHEKVRMAATTVQGLRNRRAGESSEATEMAALAD
jgi:hypothetical protein